MLTTKPEALSLTPRSHQIEEENGSFSCPLIFTQAPWCHHADHIKQSSNSQIARLRPSVTASCWSTKDTSCPQYHICQKQHNYPKKKKNTSNFSKRHNFQGNEIHLSPCIVQSCVKYLGILKRNYRRALFFTEVLYLGRGGVSG